MADPLLVEIGLGAGDWADISDRVYDRSEITITRGLQSEDGTAGPGQAQLALKNDDGMFAVRNPTSPLFGLLGRNAPLRISYGRGAYGLVLTHGGNGNLRTVDNAATSITGDIDVRIDLELLAENDGDASWKWPTAGFDLCSKWNYTPGELSWAFLLLGGTPHLRWSADGATGLTINATTTLAGPDKGRRALRFTLDVNNGASGRTARFYQAPTIAGPWTQIGTDVVQAGVTSIFDGTANNRLGAAAQSNSWTWGRSGPVTVYDYEIRNGINGTLVADPNPTAQPRDPVPFASSAWTDALGNNWFLSGSADVARIWYGDVDIRHTGEIASLPNRFSLGLHDKWVPITSNGVLRRYGQGNAPTANALRDFTLRPDLVDALAAYWPLNGEEGTQYSLNLAPNLHYLESQFYPETFPGPNVPVFKYGVDMGSDNTLGTGLEINATSDNAYMRGDVGTGDPNFAVDFVFQSAAFGVLTVIAEDYNHCLWTIDMNTPTDDATIQVSFTDPEVGPIGYSATGVLPELQDGAVHHCRLQVTTTGSNSAFALYLDGALIDTGSNPGYVPYGVAMVRFYYTRYINQTYVNLAHVTVWANTSAAQIPTAADTADAVFGYAGDTAAERMTRVADDGNIPLVIVGDPADTMPMGVLNAEPRLAQIRDAEATDMGILHEARDSASLLYRTRRSMTGQSPALTLEFGGGMVMEPLEPIDDDQLTRNDVTASRRNGGSYRAVQETGPMSVQDPPLGVGLYDDEITVNVQTDALLAGVAAWVVNVGTLDKARYPSVSVELAAPGVDDPTTADVYAVDVGDLLRLTDASAIGEYDDMDLLIVGYTETIGHVLPNGRRKSLFTFVCRPGDMYKAALYGTARYDTGGSTLAAAATSTATSLSLATVSGAALWTTTGAPFDLWINGERVTVTAVTGSSSPQTATVVRSVNGVVKAQPAGATVRLFDTPRYVL